MIEDRLLISDPRDVTETVDKMTLCFPLYPSLPAELHQEIEEAIKRVKVHVQSGSGRSMKWGHGFIGLGAIALKLMMVSPFTKEAWDPNAFAEMLLGKHRLYGPKPIISWGPVGVVMRIDSKFERYKHLIALPPSGQEESVVDTIKDIIGYCVLGYRMMSEGDDLFPSTASAKPMMPSGTAICS